MMLKSNWPYISDHPYRILIIGGSESGRTNVLLKVIKHQQPYIDKIYVCQRYIQIKVSIAYQQKRKKRD